MKKNYITPSVETDLLDISDVITASEVSKIDEGEFGVSGIDVFGERPNM